MLKMMMREKMLGEMRRIRAEIHDYPYNYMIRMINKVLNDV
jgi:hypothetical protein